VGSPLSDKTSTTLDIKNVVVNDLHPRCLPHLHTRVARLRVRCRELWLTLHGEAHFRSLHCANYTPDEVATAKELLAVLHARPEPPPPPPTPTSKVARSLPRALPEPEPETCPVCLDPIKMVAEGEGANGGPAKPNTCEHRYHLVCLQDWGQLANTCPLCKRHFQAIERLLGGRPIPVVDRRLGNSANYNRLEVWCGGAEVLYAAPSHLLCITSGDRLIPYQTAAVVGSGLASAYDDTTLHHAADANVTPPCIRTRVSPSRIGPR
jgi:hypothetical protein